MSPRRLPPLNAVRAFEAAGRHESFSRGAEELFVTPAAVSQQVRALEHWLGVQLFERKARGLALTPAGRSYLPRVSEVLDRLADATQSVRRLGHSSILSVGVTPGFASLFLAPRLWRFASEHPELDVRIATQMRPVAFDEDTVDVAVRYGRGDFPGLSSEFLLRDGVTPICSPRLLEANEHPLRSPEDLRYYTLLHNESAVLAGFRVTWKDWLDAAGAHQVDCRRGPRFSDVHLVMQEALAGHGVGLGHMALIGEELRAGRLVAPFDLVLAGGGDYHVVYPPGAEEQPKVAAFLKWLRAQVSES
ncbi:transcriptional regulator GcvA [Alkalilimnicola sp. S0819]|uniref:transcriptional regulator GcvA n=1 Tax=Alkalilimnicola sp. S0819 TaxID=2613922 RepID=UPI00126196E5|nr:transcriptional regulator GcvA [Alkalilimnicola sp. S0819]KAB7628171.1 transcriptional regulator GcvA [Alkalilimnicola sp. S0819]MPQ15058.1 transcriptional regulator GcvA [Alkalilimnicola sp. S0819]